MKGKESKKSKSGLSKPAKAKESYKGDAHPMSPVSKQGQSSVWDKRAK